MDGSPVLRQQSQNTIRSDIFRTMSEQNKLSADSKSSKAVSLHPLLHNLENQDPGSSGQVRPHHVRPGVSRLPILAKSHHLQTPKEFTQSHSKWEGKPLAGKARSKKPCTRPVPFNFSQPKSTRLASENQQPDAIHPIRTSKLNNNICSSQIKITNRNSKHSGTVERNFKSSKTLEPLGQSRLSHKTSGTVSKPVSCAPNSVESNAAAAEKPSAETCSKNMHLLSLKDPSCNNTKTDNFQRDHAALLSILRNEGVTSTMTLQTKSSNYLPQRVSVMKSRHKAEVNAGFLKSVTFSPNHGALQSILKNEGVKAGATSDRAPSIYTPMRVPVKKNVAETGTGLMGSSMKTVQFSPNAAALQSIRASEQNEWVDGDGPDGATPRNSVCPTGRNTSIYTAQRVPVKKHLAEPSPAPLAARKQTPAQKWTPQRVTRLQPMSSFKLHTSQPSPYAITPGFRSCKANLGLKQEVVQKLFEDEENVEQAILPQTELPPDLTTHKDEMLSLKMNDIEKDGFLKEEAPVLGPFIQNPERESVIFFSTGKKLLREPLFKQPGASEHKPHNPEDSLPVLQQSRQISTTVTQDLQSQTDVINPAVALLRKRLPLLEELRLDEEVATYTSVSVPAVPGFHPPRPRCGNPVATTLHFEESTRFVPISVDVSPMS